ncbi:hypothetical protein MTP05_01700 [Enterococcus sp. PLM3]|nr:hypothetical protein MTP05_01700 [Enterococcus sp. PLM3]
MKKKYSKLALITLIAPSLISSQITFAEEKTLSANELQVMGNGYELLNINQNSTKLIDQENDKVDENNLESTKDGLEITKAESTFENTDRNELTSGSFELNIADKSQDISKSITNNSSTDFEKEYEVTVDSKIEPIEDSSNHKGELNQNTEKKQGDKTYYWQGLTLTLDSEGTLHVPSGTVEEAWGLPSSGTKKIIFEGPLKITRSMKNMFGWGGENITTIENLDNIDTSSVTNMENVFGDCKSIEDIDISSWNTENVTSFVDMFYGCSSLKTIDLSNLNTSSAENMSEMFARCSSLIHLNLSSFETENVEEMRFMFTGCSSLTELDLSNFDTSSVTSMSDMFSGCSSLGSLDISSFDTTNVISFAEYNGGFFYECNQLKKLHLGEKFNGTQSGIYVMSLPQHPSNEEYFSTWQNVGSGTVESPNGKNIWSSAELIKNYNGTIDKDIYVWKPKNMNPVSIVVKDSTLTVGDKWDPTDNFVSATDKDGNAVDFSKVTVIGNVDTTRAGEYKVTYSYAGIAKEAKITVKEKIAENQKTVVTKDSTLTVGDKWDPTDNFVSATDKDGNAVDFSKVTVIGNVDTTRAGEYKVTYSYAGIAKEAKITVKEKIAENQKTVVTKDSTLTVGDKWDPTDNFVSATDKDGNAVDFSKVTVIGSVDTTKAGEYKVTYSYDGVTKEAKIIVEEADEGQSIDATKDNTLIGGSSGTSNKIFPQTGEKINIFPFGAGVSLLAVVSYLYKRRKQMRMRNPDE